MCDPNNIGDLLKNRAAILLWVSVIMIALDDVR